MRPQQVPSILASLLLTAAAPAWSQSIATDGNIETKAQLVSNVAAGTPPLSVSSTTMVPNLNADQVDGVEGTALALNADLQKLETMLVELQAAVAGSRTVYMTGLSVLGNSATAACTAAGFHMASIWEIPDARSLTYDKTATGAYTGGDLGEGPPAGRYGWIRTGSFSSDADVSVGTPNCLAWTGTAGHGTVASLNNGWTDSSGIDFLPGWYGNKLPCNTSMPVWCVED